MRDSEEQNVGELIDTLAFAEKHQHAGAIAVIRLQLLQAVGFKASDNAEVIVLQGTKHYVEIGNDGHIVVRESYLPAVADASLDEYRRNPYVLDPCLGCSEPCAGKGA